MTRTLLLFVLALVTIGGAAAWYLIGTRNAAFEENPVPTMPGSVQEGQAIYTNGSYGFSVMYPESARIEYSFTPEYHLGTTWRANAFPNAVGTPIVSIIPYAIARENSYPRYFNALVRIGASDDPKEVAACEKPTTDQGEVALSDVSLGGRMWKAFSFENAGMMQYVRGVSYRTLYEGRCIALEKIQTGSSYRDSASAEDMSDEVLQGEYAKLDTIVESFFLARP